MANLNTIVHYATGGLLGGGDQRTPGQKATPAQQWATSTASSPVPPGGAPVRPLGTAFGSNPAPAYGDKTPSNNYPVASPGTAGSLGGRRSAAFNNKMGGSWASAIPTYGSQSGPTTVENWFNQRASGTDPAWEYEMGKATDSINNQYAARGGYNSSGAMNSLDDMFANASAQREGQLDTLANQATTAHQNALDQMFNQGNTIASGASGAGQPFATGAGTAMSTDMSNQITLQLQKAGVDQKTIQSVIDSLTAIGKTGASFAGGKSA